MRISDWSSDVCSSDLRAQTLAAWVALLARLGSAPDLDFVDWLAVDRVEGREYDIGVHRHWLDPARPLARVVLEPAHGALVTSATLKGADGWPSAEVRIGAAHLDVEPARFAADRPFDSALTSELLIVTAHNPGDLAAPYGAFSRLVDKTEGR